MAGVLTDPAADRGAVAALLADLSVCMRCSASSLQQAQSSAWVPSVPHASSLEMGDQEQQPSLQQQQLDG